MRQSPRAWAQQLNLRGVESRHGLPAGILEALAYAETRGNSGTAGDGGRSTGLFQIMDSTGGEELRDRASRYTRFGDFSSFRPGRSPQVDAEAAATLLNISHDVYLRDGEPNLARMLASYNAGAPRIARDGYGAVASSAYDFRDRRGNLHAGYVPTMIAYLRMSGFTETADRILADVRELPAGEVDMPRFNRAIELAMTEHRGQIEQLNGRASVVPTPPSTPPRATQPRTNDSIADNFNEQDKAQLVQLAMGAMCVTTRAGLVTEAFPMLNGTTAVFELQRNLEAAGLATDRGGADGRVDGIAGTRTREAIRVVERALGITEDGIMDRTVETALRDPNFRNALRSMVRDEAQDHNASDRVLTPPQDIVLARPRNLADRIFT